MHNTHVCMCPTDVSVCCGVRASSCVGLSGARLLYVLPFRPGPPLPLEDEDDYDVALFESNAESALSPHVQDVQEVKKVAEVQLICRGKAGQSIYDVLNKLRKQDAVLKRKADH